MIRKIYNNTSLLEQVDTSTNSFDICKKYLEKWKDNYYDESNILNDFSKSELNNEQIFNIEHCNFLQLFVWINKSFWKKIMLNLGVTPIDYYWVRRRKINVIFSFFFDLSNKDINLDIVKRKGDSIEIFIVCDLVFIKEINEIMTKYYVKV